MWLPHFQTMSNASFPFLDISTNSFNFFLSFSAEIVHSKKPIHFSSKSLTETEQFDSDSYVPIVNLPQGQEY